MRQNSYIKKIIAAFILLIFSVNIAQPQAYSAQPVDGSSVRTKPKEGRSIPAELGTLEESFQGKSKKNIFYIQDAHDSLEAQKNIAKMIQYLVGAYGVKTVYEEGYEGPVPSDKYFKTIPDPKVREKVAYFLMDKLRLGGAEYAHITRTTDFQLIGADSFELHRKNIEKYQESAKHREETAKNLAEMDALIRKLAQQYFTKTLKDWMAVKERYDRQEIDLLDYLRRTQALFLKGIGFEEFGARYPNISLLLSADKTKDEKLLGQLKTTINYKTLFAEINQLEDDYAGSRLREPRDGEIFNYYKQIQLLKRLNTIEVTEEEYAAVKEKLKMMDTQKMAQFLAGQSRQSVVLSRTWESHIQSAIEFYEVARARDSSIRRCLEAYGRSSSSEPIVLVYGGFHKGSIKELLNESGLSYDIVSPKITSISLKHQAYYKQLMQMGYDSMALPSLVAKATTAPHLLEFAAMDRKIEKRLIEQINVLAREAQLGRTLPEMDLDLTRNQTERLGESAAAFTRSEVRANSTPLSDLERLRKSVVLLEEMPFIKNVRGFGIDDLRLSAVLAEQMIHHPLEKVFVAGTGLRKLPVLLALIGKQVFFLDLDASQIREVQKDWDEIRKALHGRDTRGLQPNFEITTFKDEFGGFDAKKAGLLRQMDAVTLVGLAGGGSLVGDVKEWFSNIRRLLKPEGALVIDESRSVVTRQLERIYPGNTRKLLAARPFQDTYNLAAGLPAPNYYYWITNHSALLKKTPSTEFDSVGLREIFRGPSYPHAGMFEDLVARLEKGGYSNFGNVLSLMIETPDEFRSVVPEPHYRESLAVRLLGAASDERLKVLKALVQNAAEAIPAGILTPFLYFRFHEDYGPVLSLINPSGSESLADFKSWMDHHPDLIDRNFPNKAAADYLRDIFIPAARSEVRMDMDSYVRSLFAKARVPFRDEEIRTDRGIFRPQLNDIIDEITEEARSLTPIHILDLGSGQGGMVFAFAAANPYAEVLGIEYDPDLYQDSLSVLEKGTFPDLKVRVRFKQGDFNAPDSAREIRQADFLYYYESGSAAEGHLLDTLNREMKDGAKILVVKNNGYVSGRLQQSENFTVAQRHERFWVFQKTARSEVRTESLNAKIQKQWDDRMSRKGVFLYELSGLKEKQLGKYIVQTNPGRETREINNKRPEIDSNPVMMPFGTTTDFTQIYQTSPDQKLFEEPIKGEAVTFSINFAPITRYHFLAMPYLEEKAPQALSERAFITALGILEESDARGDMLLGFNSPGTWASINHLHFQGVFASPGQLAVEQAPQKKVADLPSGVQLFKLSKYPLRALIFKAESNSAVLAAEAYRFVKRLQEEDIPHVVIMRKGQIMVFPRVRSSRLPLAGGIGFLESAGRLYVPEGQFETITEAALDKVIMKSSVNAKVFNRLVRNYLRSRSEVRTDSAKDQKPGAGEEDSRLAIQDTMPIWYFLRAFGFDPQTAKIIPDQTSSEWGRVFLPEDSRIKATVRQSALRVMISEKWMNNLVLTATVRDLMRKTPAEAMQRFYLLTNHGLPAALVWPMPGAVVYYPFLYSGNSYFFMTPSRRANVPNRAKETLTYMRAHHPGKIVNVVENPYYDDSPILNPEIHVDYHFEKNPGVSFPSIYLPSQLTTSTLLAVFDHINFRGKSVNDIGSGNGRLAVEAAERGAASVTGYEPSELGVQNTAAWAAFKKSPVKSVLDQWAIPYEPADIYLFDSPNISETAQSLGAEFAEMTYEKARSSNLEIPLVDFRAVMSKIAGSMKPDSRFYLRVGSSLEPMKSYLEGTGLQILRTLVSPTELLGKEIPREQRHLFQGYVYEIGPLSATLGSANSSPPQRSEVRNSQSSPNSDAQDPRSEILTKEQSTQPSSGDSEAMAKWVFEQLSDLSRRLRAQEILVPIPNEDEEEAPFSFRVLLVHAINNVVYVMSNYRAAGAPEKALAEMNIAVPKLIGILNELYEHLNTALAAGDINKPYTSKYLEAGYSASRVLLNGIQTSLTKKDFAAAHLEAIRYVIGALETVSDREQNVPGPKAETGGTRRSEVRTAFAYTQESLTQVIAGKNWGVSVLDRFASADAEGKPKPSVFYSLGGLAFPDSGSELQRKLLDLQDEFEKLPWAEKFFRTPAQALHLTLLPLGELKPRQEPFLSEEINQARDKFKAWIRNIQPFELIVKNLVTDPDSGRIQAEILIPAAVGGARQRAVLTLFTPYKALAENERQDLSSWIEAHREDFFGQMAVNEIHFVYAKDSFAINREDEVYALRSEVRSVMNASSKSWPVKKAVPVNASDSTLDRSYIARHQAQWTWLRENILSSLAEQAHQRSRGFRVPLQLSVLVIGSATGEEMARSYYELWRGLESLGENPANWQIIITGVDNEKMLHEAQARFQGKSAFYSVGQQDASNTELVRYADSVIGLLRQKNPREINGLFDFMEGDVLNPEPIRNILSQKKASPDLILVNHVLRVFGPQDQVTAISGLIQSWPQAVLAIGDYERIGNSVVQVSELQNHAFESFRPENFSAQNSPRYFFHVPESLQGRSEVRRINGDGVSAPAAETAGQPLGSANPESKEENPFMLERILENAGPTEIMLDAAAKVVSPEDLAAELARIAKTGKESRTRITLYNIEKAQREESPLFKILATFPKSFFRPVYGGLAEALQGFEKASNEVNLIHYSEQADDVRKQAPKWASDRFIYLAGKAGSAVYGLSQIRALRKAVALKQGLPDLEITFDPKRGYHFVADSKSASMISQLALDSYVAFAQAA